ncbi:MAG: hypothetical protein HPY85_00580 [Anaerolineae bacterium]|jgi:hypothetical protein|nr:hypothetical protein [Anaerolineae bacterium]
MTDQINELTFEIHTTPPRVVLTGDILNADASLENDDEPGYGLTGMAKNQTMSISHRNSPKGHPACCSHHK